jgi:hypothetical protein
MAAFLMAIFDFLLMAVMNLPSAIVLRYHRRLARFFHANTRISLFHLALSLSLFSSFSRLRMSDDVHATDEYPRSTRRLHD